MQISGRWWPIRHATCVGSVPSRCASEFNAADCCLAAEIHRTWRSDRRRRTFLRPRRGESSARAQIGSPREHCGSVRPPGILPGSARCAGPRARPRLSAAADWPRRSGPADGPWSTPRCECAIDSVGSPGVIDPIYRAGGFAPRSLCMPFLTPRIKWGMRTKTCAGGDSGRE